MNAALIQKLLISIAGLTAIYLTFINVLHQDLIRKISRSFAQLIPGILLVAAAFILSKILRNPELVFKYLLPIKSGTGRKIIGTNLLPLIAESIYTIGIITGLTAIIDKLLYFWRKKRLPYLLSLIIIILSTIIAAAALLAVISGEAGVTTRRTEQLHIVRLIATNILGITALILTIINITKLIGAKKQL